MANRRRRLVAPHGRLLEPETDQTQVAMLRAVVHREISVDQALKLLDSGNGHRSAIL